MDRKLKKESFTWQEYAKIKIGDYFWPWEKINEFRNLRDGYMREFRKRSRRILFKEGKELLTPELLAAIKSMNAKVTPFNIERFKDNKKVAEDSWEIHLLCKPKPISSGHFGLIFDYSEIQGLPAVIKIQRYENVKSPLDVYSYLMEIIILLVIQYRDLHCTPQILNVVKTKQVGDVGYVMEQLHTTLYDFFIRGYGSIHYDAGLKVLRDLAAKVHILQKVFQFRHRDLRMKNVMLVDEKTHRGCVRIIDLGKSSITFEGQEYHAYPGSLYETVTDDFDLGFFFGDMLIHFERSAHYRNQLLMYEPILLHFLQGVRYQSLVDQEVYLNRLMEKVHLRPTKTKKFCMPEYVHDYLNREIEKRRIKKRRTTLL